MENQSIVWRPNPELLDKSYAARLMKKLGCKNVKELREASIRDIDSFWKVACEDMGLEWYEPFEKVLDLSKGIEWTEWFIGGKTNIILNCLDRHLASYPHKTAIQWEGDDGAYRELSYSELNQLVCKTACVLEKLNVRGGDTVGILMPMVPEVVAQLFGCFKIGAIAIPIFSGFGAEAIATRLEDAQAKVLFTSDVSFRRGKVISVKKIADLAVSKVASIKTVIVFQRGTGPCDWNPNRDKWWHEFVLPCNTEIATQALPSESKSLILYTSGTTGKPKGAIHTHAGCLATIGKELRYAFNVDSSSRFFWLTDIGWMMGPWEMIGVTFFGGSIFLYEGAPDYPSPDRLWNMIQKYNLSTLGISPTAIRLLMRYPDSFVKPYEMRSLEFLGSTGEPWDPESYLWFFEKVGKKRCPIINISGGTEIVGCLLSPLPIEPLKTCSLGGPGLGVDADVFNEDGQSVRGGIGHLVCKQPLPSMTKGFLKNRQRYLDTYFSKFKGVWYHGDWAHVDSEGFWFLHGRSDDTIKIAGKRIGPAEFESALISDSRVSEAAAIGIPHKLKGEGVVCFVVLKPDIQPSETLRLALFSKITEMLGKTMAAEEICFTTALPKTRSAKIVRGIVRKIYLNEAIEDTASIENLESLEAIRKSLQS